MRAWPIVLVLAAACGERELPVGPSLPEAADLTIVAHQDDDLLFMQPDVTDVVEARSGLLNLYVTAGDGGRDGMPGIEVFGNRAQGLLEAYAEAAGLRSEWTCGWIEIAGQPAEHCRLDEANVSLAFLGYPDGGREGQETDSLLHLWQGDVTSVETIGLRTTHYDQATLIATVAEVIATAKPKTIRTLEIASTHGRDHSDHMLVGALALLATAKAGSHAELIAYRGYDTAEEPETLIEPLFQRSENLLAHYDACALGCGECGTACKTISEVHTKWLRRRYAIGTRPGARGALRANGMCAGINADGAPTAAPCTATPTLWELTADGLLRSNGRCLGTLPTGELFTSPTCTPDPIRRFFLDDEGLIWLGAPPLAEPAMDYAHLMCLGIAGGRPRAALCGENRVAHWEISGVAVSSTRPLPALPGRAVRLGDLTGDGKADLCFVDAGTLRCAPGTGDGAFGPVVAVGVLAVEPESLVVADMDGDHRPDACGRDASGLTCALSTMAFSSSPWSPALARTGGVDSTDRSLAAADADGDGHAELCALGTQGVVCAPRGLAAITMNRSSWPATGAAMWSGDLDGDSRADWCVSQSGISACGLDRDRSLTTDGVPWSFALAGAVDPAPPATAVGALADIDGDRRADLCTVSGRAITCARSQGHGFGPQVTLATLPGNGPLTALWLGDLDGDGVLDACAEDGASVTCLRN